MIILNTNHLLQYLKLQNIFIQKEKIFTLNPSNGKADKPTQGNAHLICTALTARSLGDSINYELSTQKIAKNYLSFKHLNNIDLLALILLFESNLVNCSFVDYEENEKNVFQISEKIITSITNYNGNIKCLLLALIALNQIFYNKLEEAKHLLSSFPVEENIYLKTSLMAFLSYQMGDHKNSYKLLNDALATSNVPDSKGIFHSLCLNFLTYLQILDYDYKKFKGTYESLEGTSAHENSNIKPMMLSNISYLKQNLSDSSFLWKKKTGDYHNNISLYIQSTEINLLEQLKNSSLKIYADEVHASLATYGRKSFRFTNSPNLIGDKLTKLIFMHSYFGNFYGAADGQALLYKIFLSLGISNNDQTMIKRAAHYAIIRGAINEIDKIFKMPRFIKDKETIDYFSQLMNQNYFGGPSATGISSMIRYIYRFLDPRSITAASKHLSAELKKQASSTSNFNRIRPTLESSIYLSDVTSKKDMEVLMRSFFELVKSTTLEISSLTAINDSIKGFPDNFFLCEQHSTRQLTKFYFENIEKMLELHFETTIIALTRLVLFEESKINTKNLLNRIEMELEKKQNPAEKIIFLLNIKHKLNKSITKEISEKLFNLLRDSILNSNSDSYKVEGVNMFDPISLFSEVLLFFDLRHKQATVSILKKALFDEGCSISNKVRIANSLIKIKEDLGNESIAEIQKHLLKIRENIFVGNNPSPTFSFKSTSTPILRALLYHLASLNEIGWAESYLLDILRLSVSTDYKIRQMFVKTAISFCKSNSKNTVAIKTLLNRCYELSFDADPQVRGMSCSAMLDMSKFLDSSVYENIFSRLDNLSRDPSEITRINIAVAIIENKKILSGKLYGEIKSRLSKDIDFYIRKKISDI